MLFGLLLAAHTAVYAAPPVSSTPGDAASGWEATLARVAPAVVSIHVTATRDFDTEDASNSQGTGFVVDAERGLILTNRHMVHAGPVTARATFLDNEEADLVPVYRDPVHDFGFYRFDPSDVRFMALQELTLDADAARVGLDIRVVGNDAGEKLSILDGTLARLDRNAPFYGSYTYNDFNTFYFQAASNTSGGSSGSPVIAPDGTVVALNAGGNESAASSFYLPLHRVVRALAHLQRGEPIPRGTLQATFRHRSYEELARLGLSEASEAAARAQDREANGLLVVHGVVPGGPSDTHLRPGDIVLQLGAIRFPGFGDLAEALDGGVGTSIDVLVERLGVQHTATVSIGDLHAITPDAFLEMGRAILHNVSYQQARLHDVPVSGVYVAAGGHMFSDVPEGALITHLDGQPIPDLRAMQEALASRADRQRVRVRHAPIGEPNAPVEVVQTLDRTWFPARRCHRDDTLGTWPCVALTAPEAGPTERPATVALPDTGRGLARRVGPSLVLVDFDIPYSTAGVVGSNFLGTGVVIDAEQGMVLVDRDTVPVALGDLTLTFGGTVRVRGTVRWLHPQHNVALVQYNPADVGEIEVRSVRLASEGPRPGQRATVVGRDPKGTVVVDAVEVEDVQAMLATPSGTPRFRDLNIEVARLGRVDRTVGGVLVDRKGRMTALWASFFFPGSGDRYFYGLPVEYLHDIVASVRAGGLPTWRSSGVEWRPIPLADARERGLSDARLSAYIRHAPDSLEVLEAVRVSGDSPAAGLVQPTDLLVLADGAPVSRIRDVEAWSQRPQVALTLLRDGAEIMVDLPMSPMPGEGIRRVASWSGLLLHAPHPEVALQRGLEPRGVYIAWYWYGSPAARDGVRATHRILAIDDTPTPDLDALLAAITSREPDAPVVLTLEDLDGVQDVRALEPDPAYWPLEVFDGRSGTWTREQP